jgi:guanine deaminase
MNAPDPVSMTSEACATDASMRRVLRADLLDFTADPGFALPNEATGVRWRPDHLVLIEDGRIHAVQPAAQAC